MQTIIPHSAAGLGVSSSERLVCEFDRFSIQKVQDCELSLKREKSKRETQRERIS